MKIEAEETVVEPEQPAANPGLQSILDALGNGGAQAIAEALGSGGDSAALINSFLNSAQISPEKKSIVNLLMSMDGQNSDGVSGEIYGSDDYVVDHEDDEYEEPPARHSKASDIRQFRQELNDLRDVNDTVAAALGACPICWGGNTSCRKCHGEGHAGSSMPDPGLFNELVVPAVRRTQVAKRSKKTGLARKRR